ncbi:glucose/mannose transport system permease protein [Devosia enhydra]|uniref:Glucose/mannose transport system permease protein n=1 Tax=Devosia enhydra TaxID=665118 RepID=A0A1K2HXT5_9HYPH|nr:sugar ABC transporter permease [Devosia enhydra]SFZ84599.1 glucose/mannose transport system permease protein [Devosia enhydra]
MSQSSLRVEPAPHPRGGAGRFGRGRSGLGRHAPAWLAISPSLLAILIFVYGFALWTAYVSLSASRMVPDFALVGLRNYERMWGQDRWLVAAGNLVTFTALYVVVTLAVGLLIAILLDQKVRGETPLRTIFLYPAAVSLIVTGIAWKWLLNPGTGVEAFMRSAGWEGFAFDWIIRSETVIYAIVVAAVWQQAGFVSVLFLAALRGVDGEMVKAARLDGAGPIRTYWSVIIPAIRPAFISAGVLLVAFALKTFDLVVAMTAQGPGYASALPSTFVYDMAFQRNQLGMAAAGAISILVFAAIIVLPYVVWEFRKSDAR